MQCRLEVAAELQQWWRRTNRRRKSINGDRAPISLKYTRCTFLRHPACCVTTTRRWPVRDGDGNGNRGRKTDSTPFGLISSALVCFTMTCLSLASRSYVDQILTKHLPPLHTSTPPRNYYRGHLPLVGRGQMSAKLLLFILKLVQWYKRR